MRSATAAAHEALFRRSAACCAIVAAFTLVAGTVPVWAQAQDAPHLGLVFGTGGPGLLWHVSDRWALRPEISVSGSKSQGGTGWTATGGVSSLRFIGQDTELRTYVAPGIIYSHTWGPVSTSSDRYTARLMLGIQHSLMRRLAVHGEIGPLFTRSTYRYQSVAVFPPGLPIANTTVSTSWGISDGFGIVWYFR